IGSDCFPLLAKWLPPPVPILLIKRRSPMLESAPILAAASIWYSLAHPTKKPLPLLRQACAYDSS
ncbi:hypothetical protein, partial [Chroococcidiopsis cubana]|uniref:hypothetical protein n=1 Tax=Chroococcidiopsis cubana TaxID=171392 RepID=UPI001C625D34